MDITSFLQKLDYSLFIYISSPMASGTSRRGSSSNRYEDAVDAGDAYQIYSEVVNAGKNLQGEHVVIYLS